MGLRRSHKITLGVALVVVAGMAGAGLVHGARNASEWAGFCERLRVLAEGTPVQAAIGQIGIDRYRGADILGDQPIWVFRPQGYCVPRPPVSRVLVKFVRGSVAHVELEPSGSIPFDSQDWKRSWARRRTAMSDDLLARFDFSTMSVAEIRELLGPPNGGGWGCPTNLTYDLGGGGFGFGVGILVIEVTAAGVVTGYSVVYD